MSSALRQMNAFTIDLEDWFQGLTSTNPLTDKWPFFSSRVVPATESLLDILRACQVQATFFVLGYTADQHPMLIQRIQAEGHEIGIHGYSHRYVYQLAPHEFAQELERSIEAVTSITGEMPLGHRAPYFSFNASTSWPDQRHPGGALRGPSIFSKQRGFATIAAFSPRGACYMATHKRRAFRIALTVTP